MVISNIKDMVKDGKKVYFVFYRQGELWYRTECGFRFPVPISEDAGNTTYLPEDRAMMFMKYIKKQIIADKLENETVPN